MKLRLRHTKLGKVRFTSHRDTAQHWERAVRRADVQLAYSAGFTPRPKLSFGLALPTGAESLAEYVDMELAPGVEYDLVELAPRLSDALPVGYEVLRIEERPQGGTSLQDAVVACTWQVAIAGATPAEVADAVGIFAAATEVLLARERKGQRSTDDIRPAVTRLAAVTPGADGRPRIEAELVTTGRGLRPSELVAALFPALDPLDAAAHILRTTQLIDDGAGRRELLPVTAAEPHALVGRA